ncbi:helix-turn-helix domain-containing protein [Actinomadura gamaensis]|uniref:Helix-turn-helix domain-containing protein n=1 Tax=Actinomadura gamaensis TaxID=1763541 RepID=A0ABV9U7H5_9ACTN
MPDKHAKAHILDPQASAWALYAHKLKKYRKEAGHSQAEVGVACIVSGKLISAIENGTRLPGEDMSERLDQLYGADFFKEQCRQINRELKLPAGFDQYIVQEEQAAIIYSFDLAFVPGLLQTERYAREIMSRMMEGHELEQAVATRMRRQELLDQTDPPLLVVLIREAVLRELIGGAKVMRPQLAHLIEMGKRPNISIEAVPNGMGASVSSSYALLNYVEGSPVGWTEAGFGYGHLVPDATTLHRMRVAFDLTRGEARSVGETEKLIRMLMEAL